MPIPRKLLISLSIPTIFIPGLILASLLGWNWQKDLQKLSAQGGLLQNETIFPKSGVVERAIDGDTLELTTGQVVRLIGLQSPERGQPFYRESQQFLENLAQDKKVILEYEPTDTMDKYGRLVAYVYLSPPANSQRSDLQREEAKGDTLRVKPNPDSVGMKEGVSLSESSPIMLNEQLLRSGYAKFLSYPHYRKYKYFDLLQSAEAEAKSEHRGLWSLTP